MGPSPAAEADLRGTLCRARPAPILAEDLGDTEGCAALGTFSDFPQGTLRQAGNGSGKVGNPPLSHSCCLCQYRVFRHFRRLPLINK